MPTAGHGMLNLLYGEVTNGTMRDMSVDREILSEICQPLHASSSHIGGRTRTFLPQRQALSSGARSWIQTQSDSTT